MMNHNDSSEHISIDYETKLRCKNSTSAAAEEDEACCRDALPLSMTKWNSCQNPASVQGARINAKCKACQLTSPEQGPYTCELARHLSLPRSLR
jgi:hypothetical protein